MSRTSESLGLAFQGKKFLLNKKEGNRTMKKKAGEGRPNGTQGLRRVNRWRDQKMKNCVPLKKEGEGGKEKKGERLEKSQSSGRGEDGGGGEERGA